MNAIFGGLFQLSAAEDGSKAAILPVLASGYEFRDGGRTLQIRLRPELKFSDGTPLDAAAVRENIVRNLAAPCTCAPTRWPWVKDDPVAVVDALTVALKFSRPYGAAVNAIPSSNINWIASPAAVAATKPEEFRLAPIGAGPFRVVRNVLSTELVLERNPHYWEKGKPYLDKLVFKAAANDQSAYLSLIAGDAQVVEGVRSYELIGKAEVDDKIRVLLQPPTAVYVVQLNSKVAPFKNKALREAIYYATDPGPIAQGLTHGRARVGQSFTASGGLFYRPLVSDYRTFDLERAKRIIAKESPEEIEFVVASDAFADRLATAIQTQWHVAGFRVRIVSSDLATLNQRLRDGKWHATIQRAGSFDPDAGLSRRYKSDQPFSGVADKLVDDLMAAGGSGVDEADRIKAYEALARRISDEAYGPYLFESQSAQFSTKDVTGPGLSTAIPPVLSSTGILWQDVRREPVPAVN